MLVLTCATIKAWQIQLQKTVFSCLSMSVNWPILTAAICVGTSSINLGGSSLEPRRFYDQLNYKF